MYGTGRRGGGCGRDRGLLMYGTAPSPLGPTASTHQQHLYRISQHSTGGQHPHTYPHMFTPAPGPASSSPVPAAACPAWRCPRPGRYRRRHLATAEKESAQWWGRGQVFFRRAGHCARRRSHIGSPHNNSFGAAAALIQHLRRRWRYKQRRTAGNTLLDLPSSCPSSPCPPPPTCSGTRERQAGLSASSPSACRNRSSSCEEACRGSGK